MISKMTEKERLNILNKYCPTCGYLFTIGKRARLYCITCIKKEK